MTRHRRLLPLIALIALATGLVGCASSNGGGSTAYRAELGRAPNAETLAGVSAEVLQLYGYEVELVERDLVQAGWRYLASGYRDRATVRVRPRANDLFNGSIRIVTETQGAGGVWQTAEVTPELREEYARLQKDVRTRLQRFMTQN